MEEFVCDPEEGTLIAVSIEDSRHIVVEFIFVLRSMVAKRSLVMNFDVNREAGMVFDSFEMSDLPLLRQEVIIEPVALRPNDDGLSLLWCMFVKNLK